MLNAAHPNLELDQHHVATQRDLLVQNGRLRRWQLHDGARMYGLPPEGGAGCPPLGSVGRSTHERVPDGEILHAVFDVFEEEYSYPYHRNVGISISDLLRRIRPLLGPQTRRDDLDRVLLTAVRDQMLSNLPVDDLGHDVYAPYGAEPDDHEHQRLHDTRGEEHMGIITVNITGTGWTRLCHICGITFGWFRTICAALQHGHHILQCEEHRQGQNPILTLGQVRSGPAHVARAVFTAIGALSPSSDADTQADLVNITLHARTALGYVHHVQVEDAITLLLDEPSIEPAIIDNGRQTYRLLPPSISALSPPPESLCQRAEAASPPPCTTCHRAPHRCICQHHRRRSRSPSPPPPAHEAGGDTTRSLHNFVLAFASEPSASHSFGNHRRDQRRTAPTSRPVLASMMAATQMLPTMAADAFSPQPPSMTAALTNSPLRLMITVFLLFSVMLEAVQHISNYIFSSSKEKASPPHNNNTPPDAVRLDNRETQASAASDDPRLVRCTTVTPPVPSGLESEGNGHLPPPASATELDEAQSSDGDSDLADTEVARSSDGSTYSMTWIDDFGDDAPDVRLSYDPYTHSGLNSDCENITDFLDDEQITTSGTAAAPHVENAGAAHHGRIVHAHASATARTTLSLKTR